MDESADTLSVLKQRIARTSSTARAGDADIFAFGHTELDDALGGGLKRGRVHELFAGTVEDMGSAAGFSLMLACLVRQQGPILWLRTENAERRSGGVYAPGLAELGIDPALVVLGLAPDDAALLQCAADALRCVTLGAVVIECWGNPRTLDLTASRRLALAAERTGVTALMLRVDARPTPSAADTRWDVRAAASVALEADTPGHSVIDIELLRRRAGPAGMRWHVEWDRDEQAFREPALSRPVVPLFERGPAEDLPAGIVRRTA